jgi:pimeloyl-ACP methyl ester carboxylesterase
VLEAGPTAAAEAVVFLHGNPGSCRDWNRLIGRVGEFGRALALDMPGFGRADKPNHFDYTVSGYARHLGACLAELGIKRVHLVMHDFGGPWGLAWAAAEPGALASATIINSGIWPDYHWHFYARLWRVPVLGEIIMASVTRGGFHREAQYHAPQRLPDDVIDHWYDNWDRRTRRAVLRLYRATDPSKLAYDQARVLRPLDRPALVIWGKHDRYLPLSLAERQRDAFPSAQVVVLEQSGHFPFVDDPDAVEDALLPFLRERLLD